jgi:hypothetical protein
MATNNKKSYSGADVAMGIIGALGLFAAAMKDAENYSSVSKGVVSTEKVKQNANEIVRLFKAQAERDKSRLKWSDFDHIRVESLDDLDVIEEDVKHMILALAEASTHSYNGVHEVKWAILGANYDVESSAVFNRLDANSITLKNAEDVYLVWLGLKIAKEQSTIIDDIDIF